MDIIKNINPDINILVPLLNEEDVFHNLIKRVDQVCESSSLNIEVILVDDGSTDGTTDLMYSLSKRDNRYTSIFLSKNFGHQLALSAGLKNVNASKAVFIIDGDLQDPPELLETFYKKINEGFDVVYAIRENRKEKILKRLAYNLFYRILKKLAYINLPLDSGDFAMISKRVVNHLNSMPEQSRFLRGMRTWIGFKQVGIPYNRDSRLKGRTKYSFKALLSLAFNGIFNFSEYPIRLITRLGITIFLISLIYLIITMVKKYFFGNVPEGFTAVITLITLFGGVQLIAIGIIGEYVLRIFFEVKQRPLYIVESLIRNRRKVE